MFIIIQYNSEDERKFANELLKDIPHTWQNLPAVGCHSVIRYQFMSEYETDFKALCILLDETFPVI